MTIEVKRIDLGFVNAYLLKAGADFILIDTGVAEQWLKLKKELSAAGCAPQNLKLVVITHGDADHAGNGSNLQTEYGAKVAIHAGDAAMAQSGARIKRSARGVFNRLLLWMSERMGSDFPCFTPDVLLEDGQSLLDYGFAVRVLHTPGHTPGSISLLTDEGDLFAGDTLTNRAKPAAAPLIENESDLRKSLAALKQTQARQVYPGHGKPFTASALANLPD